MICCNILITIDKNFSNKEEFKNYMVEHHAPKSDPFRQYNFNLMDKYGHHHFFLTFLPPNKGILTHQYQTIEEYEGCIEFRNDQAERLRAKGIKYEISDFIEVKVNNDKKSFFK